MLPPRPMPQHTVVLPPVRREPWYRRLLASPRYLVLAIAGVLVLGGGAVFGVTQLVGDDSAAPSGQTAGNGGSGGEPAAEEEQEGGNRRTPVVPADVTVAVLNGTTVPGLAQSLSERVAGEGFDVGTVANSPSQDQQRAESVVLFSNGHERDAVAVSRRLGINQRQLIDPVSQDLAGDATVVVIAGADLAQ